MTRKSLYIFEGKQIWVNIKKYSDIKKINQQELQEIKVKINSLLVNCWGTFPDDFVSQHIFGANKMILAYAESKLIGLCVMSIRNILNKKIHYMEFLLINKEFQKSGLGSSLSYMMIRQEIIKNFLTILLVEPLEIFFITPNIRVLNHTAKISSFIYPDPYQMNEKGEILPADDVTWKIALELLKQSDNPNRNLHREGLVLFGSYASTPWLVYNNDNAPWHRNEKVNMFARKYLGYEKGEDKELMVRAHINLTSIINYILKM